MAAGDATHVSRVIWTLRYFGASAVPVLDAVRAVEGVVDVEENLSVRPDR